jgi:2-methylisocitrate lyase-like PEP mutase family enzyme
MSSFETFSQLHQQATPFVLGNSWDVNSATLFEAAGYKAIGTSSMAVAGALGYDDGEKIPFEALLRLAKRTVEVVRIPVSVDVEGGYSRTMEGILENIQKLHDVGVVGINLEDTTPGIPPQLQSVVAFQKILSIVAEHISKNNMKMFINVRTDGFLLQLDNALNETLTRIKHYEQTGANGIFVPFISNKSDIEAVTKATKLPLNVMCTATLPNFDVLASLGVKRISMGPFLYSHITKKTEEAMAAVLQHNSFAPLF